MNEEVKSAVRMAIVITSIPWALFAAYINASWYKICQQMNDSWFARMLQVIDECRAIIQGHKVESEDSE